MADYRERDQLAEERSRKADRARSPPPAERGPRRGAGRCLAADAVTFAWIAANPGEDRHQRFLKSDALARLAADDDARAVGVSLLAAEKRGEYERQRDGLPKEMPDLRQRAEAADAHWAGLLPGLEPSSDTRSYRGLYAIAYRHHSAIAHASLMGLNFVTIDLPDGGKRAAPLGWPDAAAVEAAFE